MVVFCIQFLFVLLVAVLQVSFLNVAFPDVSVNALLAVSIVWTLTRGFLEAWPWVVCLGCVSDMLSMDIVGTTAFVLLLFSYGSSFISRRLLVEHRESGMVLAIACMLVFSSLFSSVLLLFRHFVFGVSIPSGMTYLGFGKVPLLLTVFLNIALLAITYGIVSKMNRAFDFYGDRVVVKR